MCMAPIAQYLENTGMAEYELSKPVKAGHCWSASKTPLNGVLLVDRL